MTKLDRESFLEMCTEIVCVIPEGAEQEVDKTDELVPYNRPDEFYDGWLLALKHILEFEISDKSNEEVKIYILCLVSSAARKALLAEMK